jgi:HD-GYP domain-containing protein (c-di-GMP phosphodiesterase class II)
MIKIIPTNQLKIGMYIHDLNCGWMDHPFARNRFMVNDVATLNKILGIGVDEVDVDTDIGADVEFMETGTVGVEEIEGSLSDLIESPPGIIVRLSPAEEFDHAKHLYSDANKLMQDMMKDVRLGKQIDLEQCEPIIDNIVDSIFRFPSALLLLAQLKTVDEYAFQHSISVATLAVAFGGVLELPREEIKDLALAGLLHDVGNALVPGRILNKPGKLNGEDFYVMKSHVLHTAKLLNEVKNVSEITFNAAIQHHERYDGTGYPNGLKGDEISLHGQMLAIVDVYDAITSIRVYQKRIPPAEALGKLLKLSGAHFNNRLVQAFIKGIGIYPAGSLVLMESGKLGIVRELVPDKLLQPIVQLIYDCKRLCHITPETVDLSTSNDKIKSNESFEKWGINQSKWVMASI